MKKKFWVWDELEENLLRIEGVIAEESWLGDEITPKQFKAELSKRKGDITVWVNSPGGCVFAAVSLYNMLKEHDGKITVKIDSLAASAASVVAMAGDEVLMSPSALMLVHDPMSIAFGNESDLTACIDMLKEVKEAILNAYELKTGAQRAKLSQFMTNETWLNTKKAIEWGFADAMLYKDGKVPEKEESQPEAFSFNSRAYTLAVVNKLKNSVPKALTVEPKQEPEIKPALTEEPFELKPIEIPGTALIQLEKRLNLIK